MGKATSINPGLLRHRVRILRSVLTADGAGGSNIETYEVLATVKARVEEMPGKEVFGANEGEAAIGTHRVTLRHRFYADPRAGEFNSQLTEQNKLEYKGRFLEIVSPPVNLEGRDRIIQLMCREIKRESALADAGPV